MKRTPFNSWRRKRTIKKDPQIKGTGRASSKSSGSHEKGGSKKLNRREWEIKQDLVLWRSKVYVPKNDKLRLEIVHLHHDTPIGGHGGQWKMTELVT